jgi:glyoxylase-like metal-dependent hydrolase (beta-lactamase superfamily II)
MTLVEVAVSPPGSCQVSTLRPKRGRILIAQDCANRDASGVVAGAEVECITAPNPGPMTLEGTNTYVVGREPAVVIDPGPGDRGHIEAVRAEAERRGGIGAVLLTHSHADHAEGVEMLGVEPTPLADGEDAFGLRALATPGHAADHLCFLRDGDYLVCFAGDLILGEGSTIVPPAAHGGSLADYTDSLRKLQVLEIERIYPGHGPVIADPAAKIAEYIAHREEREAKLVAALESGERSRVALLNRVWDDVPAELRPAAAYAMQAHVEKLAAEGKLREEELSE